MANKNNNNNRNNNHSFYKEANKSILGQQQISPQKIGKAFFKIIKWLVFAFLIVATLWGCVNEFIIQTSDNLGQGVEFYQKDDFVYPNMYQATEVVGYTASEYDAEADDGIYATEEEASKATSEPFNFMTINPNYNLKASDEYYSSYMEENPESEYTSVEEMSNGLWNSDAILIQSSDIKSTTKSDDGLEVESYSDNAALYSYNLNQLTVSLTGLYDYSIDDLLINQSMFAPSTSIPTYISNEANNAIEGSDNLSENDNYSVTGMDSFIFFLLDKEDGAIDNNITNLNTSWAPEGFITKTVQDDDATTNNIDNININGTIKPSDSFDVDNILKIDGWTPIVSLDQNTYNGEMQSFYNEQVFLSGDLSGTTTQQAIDKGAYSEVDAAYANEHNAEPGTTTAAAPNMEALKPTDSNINVYGGSQVVVTSIAKGFPVVASDKTKALIDGGTYIDENTGAEIEVSESEAARDQDFLDWDSSESDWSEEGFDASSQMYGWMLMDSNTNEDGTHDILQAYDSPDEVYASEEDTTSNTSNLFYADQRRNGWGEVDATGSNSGDATVFDEMVKDNMSTDKYLSLEREETIDGQTVEYTTPSTFAGMSSVENIQVLDETYTGVLPSYEEATDNYSGENTYIETSILSDSIISTGQDAWGENRVSFVGWSDWGKAWDVQYGPLYGLFVFPLAQISMAIGEVFNYFTSPWGTLFSIIVIVFLVRGLGALLSLRGTKNQLKMQEVQTEVAKIKAKYSKYDLKEEPKMKQKQQQEIMALYRKHEVNPMGSLGTIFITMPIFISLWIIISALPAYKFVVMGSFSWAVSAWYGIFNLGLMFFLYILVGITVGLVQGVSSKMPNWLANKRKGIKRVDQATKDSMKKQNRTQNIMIGVFVFMGLTVPALFAFYWIASGFFTIFLELIRHFWRTHIAKQKKENADYKVPTKRLSDNLKLKLSRKNA